MKFEVWMEGYQTNGESSSAALLGVYETDCFDSAVLKFFGEPTTQQFFCVYTLFGDYHTYWGCRLFDNEYDARKSFG